MSPQADRITRWLLMLVFAGAMPNSLISRAQTSSPPTQPVVVSMVQLLSHPEKYEGKSILTRGFLSLQPEREYHLYLHEEDYRYALMNGMVLRLTEAQHKQFEKLNLKHVLIEGTVHASVGGHDEGYCGEITRITRMEVWGNWSRVPVKH
jgi:hypothetical protein